MVCRTLESRGHAEEAAKEKVLGGGGRHTMPEAGARSIFAAGGWRRGGRRCSGAEPGGREPPPAWPWGVRWPEDASDNEPGIVLARGLPAGGYL